MKIHCLDLDPRQYKEPIKYAQDFGSFGCIARGINQGLKEIGAYANPAEADWVGICDGLNISFKFEQKKSFVINVYETTNVLPQFLVETARRTGQKVLGLSKQVSALWAKYGFDVPVVYGGCDTAVWYPDGPKSENFTFLHVNFANSRSALDVVLQAFVAAFGGNFGVRLVIKNVNSSNTLKDVIERFGEGANISLIDERLPIDELRKLYSSSHVLLNPVRCTSFGLPLLEASACGCLVLTGDTPPTNELIRPKYGVLIPPTSEEPVMPAAENLERDWGFVNCYPNWATYNEPPRFYRFNPLDLASKLEEIHEDWDKFSSIDTRTPIVNNFSWRQSAESLVKALS